MIVGADSHQAYPEPRNPWWRRLHWHRWEYYDAGPYIRFPSGALVPWPAIYERCTVPHCNKMRRLA